MEIRIANSMVLRASAASGIATVHTVAVALPYDQSGVEVDIVTIALESPEDAPFTTSIEISDDQENWKELVGGDAITEVGFMQLPGDVAVAAQYMRLTVSVDTNELEQAVAIIFSAVARFSVSG